MDPKTNGGGIVARFDRWLDETGAKLREREVTVPSDLLGGALFLIFGVVMLFVIPGQIEVGQKEIITGRAFPNLLMYLLVACSAVLVITQIVKLARKQPVKTAKFNLLTEVRALLIFAFMLVYYFVCRWTNNFAVGSCVFGVLMLLFFRCKKPLYYAIVLAAAVLIWVAFRFGLNVTF